MRNVRLGRLVAVLSLTVGATLAGLTSVVPNASAAGKPVRGGTVTLTATWTSLDPAAATFGNLTQQIGNEVFDSLFRLVTAGPGSSPNLRPLLALGYTYSHDLKTLTINLRHGVKFSDGTEFNAQAVVFSLMRDQQLLGTGSQYLTDVTSVVAKNAYTVVIHTSQPDSNLVDSLASEPDQFIVSPTAVNQMGETQFGLTPVGAGPFEVASNTPAVSLSLKAWPGYWDAKHRYLDGVNVLEAPQIAGDSVELTDVESGSLNEFFDAANGTPSVLQQGVSNPGISYVKGASLAFEFLVMNTYGAPFNNLLAREAIDYCTNRESIAQDVIGGFASPTYIFSAKSELYNPSTGIKAPAGFYNYDPAKAEAIVQQLGGISFAFIVGTSAATQLQPTALQQEWAQCGIKATLAPEANSQSAQNEVTGNYQMYLTENGGLYNPYTAVGKYSLPSSASDKYGFSNATVTNLITATGYSDNPVALKNIWTKIYSLEDKLAVNIPLFAASNYYFYTSNLKGETFQANIVFLDNAWLTNG